MKLSSFLAQRQALLEQARLANLAFAYERLAEFNARLARSRLPGDVRLRQASADGDLAWASFTTLHGHQSVIDEHFTDEDVMDLADIVAFAVGENEIDFTFPVDALDRLFLKPLRDQLEQAGVAIDHRQGSRMDPRRCESADSPEG